MSASRLLALASFLVMTPVAAEAATPKLAVSVAAIAGGRLQIEGTAVNRNRPVSIGNTAFSTQPDANGKFRFSLDFQPPSCKVVLTNGATSINVQIGGCGLAGATGKTGPKGPTGLRGPKGPAGDLGNQGARGENGPAGPQGLIGDQGPVGVEGPAGEQGPAGNAGPTGRAGADARFPGQLIRVRVENSRVTVGAGRADVANLTGGIYIVTFNRDVSGCVYSAQDIGAVPIPFLVKAVPAQTQLSGALGEQVVVKTFAGTFAPVKAPDDIFTTIVDPPLQNTDFDLIVFCNS